jgi:hypothetical protein
LWRETFADAASNSAALHRPAIARSWWAPDALLLATMSSIADSGVKLSVKIEQSVTNILF